MAYSVEISGLDMTDTYRLKSETMIALVDALNSEGYPDCDGRREWLTGVYQDLRDHKLHPFTCYGSVRVHDSESPQTHDEWQRLYG